MWPGTFVAPNALPRAVAQLRKALGDDADEPQSVETVASGGAASSRRSSLTAAPMSFRRWLRDRGAGRPAPQWPRQRLWASLLSDWSRGSCTEVRPQRGRSHRRADTGSRQHERRDQRGAGVVTRRERRHVRLGSLRLVRDLRRQPRAPSTNPCLRRTDRPQFVAGKNSLWPIFWTSPTSALTQSLERIPRHQRIC